MRNLIFIISIICLFISIGNAQNIKDESGGKPDKRENLSFVLKDSLKPDVYIDGKKYDADIVNLLDQSLISSIDVVKGKKALEEYDAPNGVVIIQTKKNAGKPDFKIDSKSGDSEIKIEHDSDPTVTPLIMIDGKISDHEMLSKFSPDDIESIEVVKGEAAEKKYKAKHGVVIVKTKKRK